MPSINILVPMPMDPDFQSPRNIVVNGNFNRQGGVQTAIQLQLVYSGDNSTVLSSEFPPNGQVWNTVFTAPRATGPGETADLTALLLQTVPNMPSVKIGQSAAVEITIL